MSISREHLSAAMERLTKYKSGKEMLDSRIIENEQYWKMRHWDNLKAGNPNDPKPVSGWLVNAILNRHADAMAAYPEPNCLPRAKDDEGEARNLSKILPVVLKQVGFRKTYSRVMYDKLKYGTGVYGVFWDASRLNGLGDIAIRRISLLNIFWEPGVEDIQDSRELFVLEMVGNETLEERFPQLKGKLRTGYAPVKRFITEDNIDYSDKSLVVDWYYHKGGLLHYCKFCGDEILFATENDDAYSSRGWYDHGKYPFVLDVLYPEEGTPCGFGFVDICKNPQKYVDILNQAILKNTITAASPRYFIRADGEINEEEFADWTKPFVHAGGNLGQDSIMPIASAPLPAHALSVLQQKVQEMRETSGNTESATGVASSSVTAASAIAALQEASGKLSRDMNSTTYDAYSDVILLCIELIRQFYDMPRTFRITGEAGATEYKVFDNSGIAPQPIGKEQGEDMGMRTPVFDIEVVPQSETRYTKAEYNELALNLYNSGMFAPQMADQALAALEMMDFKGKDKVVSTIRNNGDMFQQLQAMQAQIAKLSSVLASRGINPGVAPDTLVEAPPVLSGGSSSGSGVATEQNGIATENPITARARAQAQQASQPR